MKSLFCTFLFALSLSCSPRVITNDIKDKPIIADQSLDQIPGISPRIQSLLAQMSLEEKIGQLNLLTPGGAITGEVVSKDVNQKIIEGRVGGIFGIRGADKVHQAQKIAVEKSRLGIPLLVGMDVIHGHQTIVPIPLGLSCSWDTVLIRETARMAAREATADGIMWGFSPMVDIARDPRWGRIAEGAGEDPFLGSAIATAMVKGYQGTSLSDPTTMMACVKHFALYGAAEGGRDYASVDMSKVKMYNEYLPPYKAAVDAGVGSVMTSFNVIDYDPASANAELYNGILRNEWGFDDLVVTDYTAINEMIAHGLGDLKDVSQLSINAGIDMDMVGEGFLTTLKSSVEEGKVSQSTIDVACSRVLMAKEKLGLFDDPYRYGNIERSEAETLNSAHKLLSRKAAAASSVLLKNEGNILPLSKKGTIAVIGPLADSRRNMLGTWSVSGDHEIAVTVIEGINEAVNGKAKVTYAKGANISDDTKFAQRVNAFGPEIVIDTRSAESMIQEALEVANRADVVIAVMGEAADMSGEASSMANISLQPSQKKLLAALKTTGKPIVMVLFNGRPMVLVDEENTMNAILDVWHPGTEAGHAVADVLFGDAEPSGRLTTSFPVHVGQIPVYHSMLPTGRPDEGTNSKFRSNYLDIPNDPLYPFGFGLGYGDVAYGDLKLSQSTMTTTQSIMAEITITNKSLRSTTETVQLYLHDLHASISRPSKELKGFQKVVLAPNETKTIYFGIGIDLLKFYNKNLEFKAEAGEFEVMIGPNSRDVKRQIFKLN